MKVTRKGRGSAREQYPLLSAYGDATVPFLSNTEAIAATREERIWSVWPYLVRTVLEFAETLSPRAKANYDPEDVLAELWVTLAEKDAKWEPEKGKYFSFAGRLIANELLAIRERASTVHAPRNSVSRLKGYEAEGELSGRKKKTYVDIRRVAGEHERIEPSDPMDDTRPGTPEVVESREDHNRRRGQVRVGVAGLTPEEAEALGRAYGLFGRDEEPVPEIARTQGRSAEHVRKVIARAQRRFKRCLEDHAMAE